METTLFHSFMILPPDEHLSISNIHLKDEWSLDFHDDPSSRHSFLLKNGYRLIREVVDSKDLKMYPGNPHDYTPCKELLFVTKNSNDAQNLQQLIYGGLMLAYPDIDKIPKSLSPLPVVKSQNHLMSSPGFQGNFKLCDDLPFACEVAEKSWSHKDLIYSIAKYRLSLSLDSISPHSASPRYGQVFANEHPDYSYHVNAAFAIIAAFSVIEELNFDIKSCKTNPRFNKDAFNKDIFNPEDVFNPKVSADLNKRLNKYSADISDTHRWIIRGEPTIIEQAMGHALGTTYEGRFSDEVRDRKLTLIDAIQYASWLRNTIASHKFSRKIPAISPYDVHNVQLLARRLILVRLGMWTGEQ